MIENVQKPYRQLVEKLAPAVIIPAELMAIRWMIEELRVSLFAQTLGTKFAISEKRIKQSITGYQANN